MDKKTFHSLIDKYIDGTASPEERALLDEYADQLANSGAMAMTAEEKTHLKDEMFRNILKHRFGSETKVIPLYRRTIFKTVAAAAIILALGIGSIVIINNKPNQAPVASKGTIKDIAPGHDGAILTLANGKTIVLDNAKDGKITDVATKKGSKISYQNSDVTKVEYNTMTTPKGRQFSLVLPDGSQVWLNAESSVTYPTAFTANERKVSITGEAYFEVSHDALKPFHVNVNGMDVQVLGTHFNVNSYEDENAVKTTLLEGAVKITTAINHIVMKPGEQSVVTDNSIDVQKVNVNDAVAWKNGFFSFRGTDVKGIMRQLSRWYDVNVIYQGVDPNETFTGKIDRNLTLSQVLKVLEETKVHYKIEDGKKLIILP